MILLCPCSLAQAENFTHMLTCLANRAPEDSTQLHDIASIATSEPIRLQSCMVEQHGRRHSMKSIGPYVHSPLDLLVQQIFLFHRHVLVNQPC